MKIEVSEVDKNEQEKDENSQKDGSGKFNKCGDYRGGLRFMC